MTIANTDCKIIYCDAGINNRISHEKVINNTIFYKIKVNKQLNISESEPVSEHIDLEYVLVVDDAHCNQIF